LTRRTLGAAASLVAVLACRPAAPSGFTLLFLGRSPAASQGGLSWAPDPERSRLLGFDAQLRLARVLSSSRLGEPMAVAALGSDRLLVTERTGDAVVLDLAGNVVREWASPDPASLYAAHDDVIFAVRSPYYIPQFAAEPDSAPLVHVLDTLGRPARGLARIHLPDPPYLAQLVNAGALAVGAGGAIYYAPLVRDEIRRYGPDGRLVWTARRGLYKEETDPHFLPARGREIPVARALVNIALAIGPDGRLYVLGSADSNATRLRLDAFDTATGAAISSRTLAATESAIAVDGRGNVVTRDADSLLAQGPATSREPFGPAFALPDLAGDTVRLADFTGKVTLVNFWASWCDPCRAEFPHMAELYRAFGRADFAIVAISDDVDRTKMLAFVQEFRPPFSILGGGGAMKGTYHYRGLPYSVLLDRRGRTIERIFGFGGPREFADLRATIAKEIAAP
jgi:thiol-disulfide isomerase/thioredoxin